MLARIVKHGDGSWRSTDACFEKIALSIESGERIVNADDITQILEERPVAMSERDEFIQRENLEDIASRVINETLDHVYTRADPAGVDLKTQLPELNDDWEVPELTIEEQDELHAVLTSENLTPHVTTTLTVDEKEEFLVQRDKIISGLDKVRAIETSSGINQMAEEMFEEMSRNHLRQATELAELEEEMIALANKSKDATVDELIEIADRVGEIEVILGNASPAPEFATLTPIKVLKPLGGNE